MSNISAKLIAYSQALNGQKIATFELSYPRYIHSELLTHRLFSRNAMSSRAVPIEKMIEQVRNDPAIPIHWGKNQPGMQAKEELIGSERDVVQALWLDAANEVAHSAKQMSKQGAHKQIVNRILEPFQTMKTVLTATEFENFFWLRNSPDAQPEIKRLAEVMLDCFDKEDPVQLSSDDWHTPYFGEGYWLKDCGIPLEDALAISASCCAQVSFRSLDDTLEKAKRIYERLVVSEPVHASPFEHQACPMKEKEQLFSLETTPKGFDAYVPRMKVGKTNVFSHTHTWQEGITHVDKTGNFWSGNFKGFIQHRQLIPNNVKMEASK